MPSISISLSEKEQFAADVLDAEGHGQFVTFRAGYECTVVMPGFGRVAADACDQLADELRKAAAVIRATTQPEPAPEPALVQEDSIDDISL